MEILHLHVLVIIEWPCKLVGGVLKLLAKLVIKTSIYLRDLSFYEKHLIPVLFLKLQKQYITHNKQITKATY